MPSVTVVIPAYNAEGTLRETLDSLTAQTFDDFEGIVVNDGSTDATEAVVSSYGDARVRVISVENGGVSRARNRAIDEAQGEFVAFLDADDLWQPNKLERQVTAFRATPAAGFCVTSAVRIDASSQPSDRIPLIKANDTCRTLLLDAMAVGCLSSGMARREVLATVGGFDPRFSQCADWDLWLRMSATTDFLILDEPLVLYRTSPGNMSGNVSLLERDTFAVLEAFFASTIAAPYQHLRGRAYGRYWMMCSGAYLHQGQTGDAVRCALNGLRSHPASISRPLGMPGRWAQRRRRGMTAAR